MDKRYALQCLGTDAKGKEFLRSHQCDLTEKQAYLESGKWANCSHFRLLDKDGKCWTEWGKRP